MIRFFEFLSWLCNWFLRVIGVRRDVVDTNLMTNGFWQRIFYQITRRICFQQLIEEEEFIFGQLPQVEIQHDSRFMYNMRHRKHSIALIFNHELFNSPDIEPRTGTEKDRDRLANALQSFGFKVIKFNNSNLREIELHLRQGKKETKKNV